MVQNADKKSAVRPTYAVAYKTGTVRTNTISNQLTRTINARRIALAWLAAGSLLMGQGPSALANDKKDHSPARTAAVVAARATQRVAIAPFAAPEQNDPSKWHPLGDEFAEMLITAMANRGVDVMERANLPALEAEQQLLEAAGTAPDGGRKLGAQFVIVGRISEFGVKTRSNAIAGILTRVLPSTNINECNARVKLDARLVDATTGRVVGVATGEGSEKSTDFALAQGGVLGWLGTLNFTSTDWLESKMARAARKAVEQIADSLAPRIPAAGPDDPQAASANGAGVALEIGGFRRLSEANDFLTALGKLGGIAHAEFREWREGVLFATAEGDRDALRQLAIRLETEADLKAFEIAVDTSTAGKISGGAHGAQRAAAPQPEQPAKG